MKPEEFQIAYPQVNSWIQQTLSAHATQAQSVVSVGFKRLPCYFSHTLLASTKFIAVEQVPVPPLSAIGLPQFSEFERGDYDGITYLDTFFVRRNRASDEKLYFHELIHIVQWKIFGPEKFIALYADGLERFGYRDSPLEVMAYKTEEAFVLHKPFDAENYVQEQCIKIHRFVL